MTELIKTFVFGCILGALGAGAMTWYLPAVDLHREASLIRVLPNGGNAEEFRMDLPRDRILVGLSSSDSSIPAALNWPGRAELGDLQAEIFKVRDANDVVIGIGSRLASAADAAGPFIEWSLHFPARGTLYVRMEITPAADGIRNGTVIFGTREFAELTGGIREEFVSEVDGGQVGRSRIRLHTTLVGPPGDVE